MKTYYLTIIGILLLIISMIMKTKEVYYNVYDTYFISETTFLLQILAMLFLLAGFVLKLIIGKKIFK